MTCAPLMADLAQVRAEPNLERRSRAALDNAERALKECRKAYEAGDMKQTAALREEIRREARPRERGRSGREVTFLTSLVESD